MIQARFASVKALQVAAFALSLFTASQVAAEQTVTVLYAGSLVGHPQLAGEDRAGHPRSPGKVSGKVQ
jgi:hypothetical protein